MDGAAFENLAQGRASGMRPGASTEKWTEIQATEIALEVTSRALVHNLLYRKGCPSWAVVLIAMGSPESSVQQYRTSLKDALISVGERVQKALSSVGVRGNQYLPRTSSGGTYPWEAFVITHFSDLIRRSRSLYSVGLLCLHWIVFLLSICFLGDLIFLI